MFRKVLLGLAFLGVAACGGSSSSDATYFCTFGTGASKMCYGWSESNVPSGYDPTTQWKNACTSDGGVAGDSCSTTNCIGMCTINETSGGYSFTQVYYFYDVSESGQSTCTFMNNPGSGMTSSWSATCS